MEDLLQRHILQTGNWTFTVAMLAGVVVTWLLTWLLLRALKRAINRKGRLLQFSDEGRRQSLYLIAQYVIWTVSVALMLEIAGFEITVLLAGSTALLVGLGLGVQEIFRDIVSGIFLLFEGTIEIGDVLELEGKVGKVTEINLRTSKLTTRDGRVMIVPNHKFITQNLHNWTHHDKQPSQFSVTVGVDYQAPESKVVEILLECARKQKDVLHSGKDHAPEASIKKFTDERMIFELSFWTHHKFEADSISAELRYAIRRRLNEEGISMTKR